MPTLYVTAPPAAADELASGLVERRLAACVNRVECQSTYRWEGEVHDEPEVLLFVKTTEDGVEAARDWLVDEHPYDVPCIERIDEEVLVPAFESWREDAVAGDPEGPAGDAGGATDDA